MKIKQISKKKFFRIFSILAAFFVAGNFIFSAAMTALQGSAANMAFTSDIGHPFAGYTIPFITGADGRTIAYCLNHNLDFPKGEGFNGVDASGVYNSPEVKGILYYGYGGAGQHELMAKYAINGDNARLMTQLTIWKYGRRTGRIPGNQGISPDINTGNAQIDGYMNELIGKTYHGSDATPVSLPTSVAVTRRDDKMVSDVITLNPGLDHSNVTIKYSGDNGLVSQENAGANAFRVVMPKSFRGNVEVSVTGPAGRDFTPTVWSSGNGAVQNLISNGGMTNRAGNTASTTINFEGIEEESSASYVIKKTDVNGIAKSGAVFEIAADEGFNQVINTLTSGADGYTPLQSYTFPEAPAGLGVRSVTLYVREKTAPEGMTKSDEVKRIVLGRNQTEVVEVSYENQFKPVTLKLVKKDAAGNFVQGVVFEVSESENFANPTTLTTGANGEISREFPTTTREKTFYVREKTVPAHLVLSTEVKNVRISAGQTGTVEYVNQFNQADLTIRKVDEKGKTVQGVVFEIADNAQFTNPQTVTTNAQGVATRRYPTTQAAKTYYIREKSVPSHLVLSKEVKTLTLAPNTNPTVTFTNEFVEREVKLSKRDVSSADPIEGVTFTIYDAEDKDNKTKIYETITNKEGDLPGLKLKPGKYKFIETHAPIGYKINPNPHFFEVLEDGTILGSTIMTDEREEYEFEIDKVDNKGNKVRGVVFEAKNKLTGEILTATTDQDSVAKFKGIWADYEITEKSAPEGYEKDNNVYVLQLKIDGTYERMKVVNNKIEAPNTGAESANFLPILAGVASILLGGTAFFAKKRF